MPDKKFSGKVILIILVILITFLLAMLNSSFPNALSSSDDKMRFFYLLTLIAFVASSLFFRRKREMYNSLRSFTIWVGIFLAAITIYSFRTEFNNIKERITVELFPSKAIINSDNSISFRKSADGHFHVQASIHSKKISFLLDTGATDVVLTIDDAKRIGVDIDELEYTSIYNTANGRIYAAPVTVPAITIGNITIYDVRASVNNSLMDKSLLGMSFLEKLRKYEVNQDTITLWQ